MKIYFLILVMVLLLSGTLSAVTYKIDVSVSDPSGQPVKGVSSTFNCKEYSYYGNDILLRSSPMKDTDASGKTSMEMWQCDVGLPSSVSTTFQGLNNNVSINLHSGTNTVAIVIQNLYDLTVIAVDQNNKPIKGVEISGSPAKSGPLSTFSGTSDDNGKAVFRQIPGGSSYMVRLKNGDEEKTYPMKTGLDNSEFTAIMATHTLSVTVLDDLNNSISGADVRISRGAEFTDLLTDSTGKASSSGLLPTTYTVKTAFSKQSDDMSVKLDKDVSKTVVFDIHAPVISDISVDAKGEKEPIYILAKATDSGSGLKEVRMYYTLNNNNWNEIQTSLTGSGMYRASIPPQAKDTQISYKIVAMDNAGNSVEELKEYVTGSGACLMSTLLLALLPFIALIASKKEGG